MYNLFYWAFSAQLMFTFSKYEDCKKAETILRNRYPDAKIWMESVMSINSFQEFMDKTDGKIRDYENSSPVKKVD